MITNTDLNAINLSPTKKDFYQIWNELLELSGKISERWDPTSTNESDPGIVLLKVLTAVADKLNYTIDANILEAFMPSAAQSESMRKLCAMVGYNMKYYKSATTTVKIAYNRTSDKQDISELVLIDKFTNIKDTDENINYVTLKPAYLNSNTTAVTVECMEGELIECETDNNNVVSLYHLDDNNRYYLPETQIAENGIFITNVSANNLESDEWQLVSNLNTQKLGQKVFAFGFDSREHLPYIQFPADISIVMEDGLRIKYLRTNGLNGSVSLRTLCKMSKPLSWPSDSTGSEKDYFKVENYTVANTRAASNGANMEGINDAYNNYKKTVGTFDTLVTCRDYMNKIYQLISEEDNTTNLVSNVNVTDIRDDINKAVTLCTFTEDGLVYKTMARPVYLGDAEEVSVTDLPTKIEQCNLDTIYRVTGTSKPYYVRIVFNASKDIYEAQEISTSLINNFDLVLYTFKNIYGLNNKEEFDNSFKYDDANFLEILDALNMSKTMAHNLIKPNSSDLACIKNYYKLNAKITTTRKVNIIEQTDILTKVYAKLYENFNMRKVDFGEEIPYESILSVIESADSRIKAVILDDPELTTKFCTVGGEEYQLPTKTDSETDSETEQQWIDKEAKVYYNKLVLNNVLAGRIPLFNYNTEFSTNYNENSYEGYADTYSNIAFLEPSCTIKLPENEEGVKLSANEVVQFRSPSLKTIKTYPAYVNYYLKLNQTDTIPVVPATMQTLLRFLQGGRTNETEQAKYWEYYVNDNLSQFLGQFKSSYNSDVSPETNADTQEKNFNNNKKIYHAIFTRDAEGNYHYVMNWKDEKGNTPYYTDKPAGTLINLYYLKLDHENALHWSDAIKNLTKESRYIDEVGSTLESKFTVANKGPAYEAIKGLYVKASIDKNNAIGELVDNNYTKYKLTETPSKFSDGTDPFTYYFVPRTWKEDIIEGDVANRHLWCGLGQKAELITIEPNTEYTLQHMHGDSGNGEYLVVNYTSSNGNEDDSKVVINEYYGPGTTIKPNFALVDSFKKSQTYKYNKTSGFNFVNEVDDKIEGMYTMGPNEQIEVRDFIKVTLDEATTNIYWERNDEELLIDAKRNTQKIIFKFDEDFVDKTTWEPCGKTEPNAIGSAYTLKEGEYFYYTDVNKLDLAFYGAGTKIIRSKHTPDIYKLTTDTKITAEEINSKGLTAAIPWRTWNLKGTGESFLTIQEYQYINLVEGDVIISIESDNNSTEINSNGFKAIKTATYRKADEDTQATLPKINFGHNKGSWEVQSKLLLNVGPNNPQTLRAENSDIVIDKVKLLDRYTNEIATLESKNQKPLSFKTNKILQSSNTYVDARVTDKDLKKIADLSIKLFSLTDSLKTANGALISTNNYGQGYFTRLTKDDFRHEEDNKDSLTLNLNIPSENFGIIMIYNTCKSVIPSDHPKVTLSKGTPTIFNKETWWEGYIETVTETTNLYNNENLAETKVNYYLRSGINVIKIEDSCELTLTPSSDENSIIIFGPLDLIKRNEELNTKLDYQAIATGKSSYDQILEDINEVDPDHLFYYTNPILNDLCIELNEKDDKDTLKTAKNWYDYNNINNKFVVSQIDSNSLKDGITIIRSSRLEG